MDLSIKEDSIRKKLANIKTELKCWESMFFRSHGRKPNKDDIESCGNEIKAAYKEYTNLKKSLLQNSSSDSGIQNIAVTSQVIKSTLNSEGANENSDGVFGTKLNKNENKNQYKINSHLKDQLLSDKHKVAFVRKRHLKAPIAKKTESLDGKNIAADANKRKIEDGMTMKENQKTSKSNDESIATDNILQTVNITTSLTLVANHVRTPNTVQRKAKPNKLNYNVSKHWLEKVRPIDEPEDHENFHPFETFEEEETKRGEKSEQNGSVQTNVGQKTQASNKEEFNGHEKQVEIINCPLKNNENKALVDGNCIKRTSNVEENAQSLPTKSSADVEMNHAISNIFPDGLSSQCDNTLKTNENNGSQISGNIKVSNNMADNSKNDCKGEGSNNNRDAVNSAPSLRNASDTQTSKNSQRKRKHTADSATEHSARQITEEESIKKPAKRQKKEDIVKAPSSAPKGKRLVSENFVAIDIQKKKYCRGKRRIKGSTYKRQQWKKKSQFSNKNTSNCYLCKGTGHWASECSKKPKGNPRKFSSYAEKKNEHYKPVYYTEDDKDCTFSFYDVPDLPRCWPRIPYRTACTTPPVAPLFDPVNGKPSQEAITEVNKALKMLGYSSFRHGQEQAVSRIVSGLSTLLVLSTGSGKSLCYQLPAYLYYKKAKYLTIVISPLVALMEDQVGNLPYGIKGACLHTNMTKTQREKVIQDVANNKIAILLLSPEALISGSSSTGHVPLLGNLPPVAFVCIDEAHCISEWSHNFRPSYLRVCKVLRDNFGIHCFLGLTATSTKSTSRSVTRHLGISDAESEAAIIKGQTMPTNLHITVSKDDNRDQALVSLLTSDRFSNCTSVIIYCTRRDETERLSSVLRTCLKNLPPTELDFGDDQVKPSPQVGKKGKRNAKPLIRSVSWDAEFYHAGMTPAQRKKVQKKFMSGELRIVVATTAFGMGLDKADVRAIIHYNIPKSFESFLQEIGRAGRDGLPAFCHIFLDKEAMDLCELRRHTHSNSVDFKAIKKLVNGVFKVCDCKERFLNSKKAQSVNDSFKQVVNEVSDDLEMPATEEHTKDPCFKENHLSVGCSNDDFTLEDLDQNEFSSDEVYLNKVVKDLNDLQANENSSRNLDEKATEEKESHEYDTSNSLDTAGTVSSNTVRCCSGHHVTLSIQETVQALDMKEENIATLLSYLEQLPGSPVTLLGTLQSDCTVQCYGGPKQMKSLAKKFLPITAVFNHMQRNNLKLADSKAVTFNAVDIADEMGWDLDPIYRELRSLQWNTSFASGTKDSLIGKSGILIEFDNLSFHVLAPGDLSDDERDHICCTVYQMVQTHERNRLLQLDALYNLFDNASRQMHPTTDGENGPKSDTELRKSIEEYFECESTEMNQFLERLCPNNIEIPVPEHKWDAISRDVRNMLGLHHDMTFTGRALARIFHGIDSPCYPATVWGRDRRFWRRYLDVNFHELSKFITAEIIRYRT